MKSPARFSLLKIKVRDICLQFFCKLAGKFPCLVFVEKPVTTDPLLESQQLLVHAYLPGCTFLFRLVQFDVEVVAGFDLHKRIFQDHVDLK